MCLGGVSSLEEEHSASHAAAIDRPNMSASCWTALVPRHQALVLVATFPPFHLLAVSAAPATTLPSLRPLLESVAAMWMIEVPDVGRSGYRPSTHRCRSCGVVTLMQSMLVFQMGTSQGGMAVTSALGLSEGTRAPRAARAVGCWLAFLGLGCEHV
jgi:hypothetical protein